MRFRSLLLSGVLALFAGPAFAQNPVFEDLKDARASYPTPMSKTQLGEMLLGVAARHPGWALLKKPAGNNCPTSIGPAVSCDYLVDVTGQGYDVLVDQEGAATPVWNTGDRFTADRLLFPISQPIPSTPSTPAPTNAGQTDIDELVALLEQHDAAVLGKLDAVLQLDRENHEQAERIYADLVKRLTSLESHPTAAGAGTLPPGLPSLPVAGNVAARKLAFVLKYILPAVGGFALGAM